MLSANKAKPKKFDGKKTAALKALVSGMISSSSPFAKDPGETYLMTDQVEKAIQLVREGADCNVKTDDGHSLFLYIIASKSFYAKQTNLKYLQSLGAELYNTADGRTPLHWAARTGDLTTCQWLSTELKQAVDAKDSEGKSPLYMACQYGRLEVAKDLVSKGAKLDQVNNQGETLLFAGAMSKNAEMTKWLIEAGKVDVATKDKDGRVAYHFVSLQNKPYLDSLTAQKNLQTFTAKYKLAIENSGIFKAIKKFFSKMYQLLFVSKKPVTMAQVEAHAKAKPSSRTAHIVKVMGLKASNVEAFKAEYNKQRTDKRVNSPFAGTMYKRLAKEPKISMEDIRDHAIKKPSSLTAKVLFKLG